jgi:hypothetical protein
VPERGELPTSNFGRLTPDQTAIGIHWLEGWEGHKADLEAVVKRKTPASVRDRTPIFQHESRHYIDWITMVYFFTVYQITFNTRISTVEPGNPSRYSSHATGWKTYESRFLFLVA